MDIKNKNTETLNKKYLKKAAQNSTLFAHKQTHTLRITMNAENYVKAFQGIMGVYGLQFLLVPKKIVCFFYIYFYSISSFLGDIVYSKSDRLFP